MIFAAHYKEKSMRMSFLLLTLCFGLTPLARADEAAGTKGHPDSSQWENLFAPDLSDAVFPEGIWSIEKGELTASKDECIWSKKQYENFIIDLEFKNGPAANSGVVFYCTDVKNWVPNSVEIQILDDYDAK